MSVSGPISLPPAPPAEMPGVVDAPRGAARPAGADAGARRGETAPAARPGAAPIAGYPNIIRARFVALGGLVSMVAAVVAIFATTGGPTGPRLAPAAAHLSHHARYWIVRPGQTLSSIGRRESVGVGELERLNPRLIPGSLVSGQRVLLPG